MISKSTNLAPTITALAVALIGPSLLMIASVRVLGSSPGIPLQILSESVMWGFLAFVLFVVVYLEKRPLSSIGFKKPDWQTVASGLLLWLIVMFVLAHVTNRIGNAVGHAGLEKGLAQLRAIPLWFRVVLAITAGIVEETLYRGYAVERLASLTGRDWLGGLIAAIVFGVAHIPAWGVGFSLAVDLPFGLLMTAFYLWRRDLLANIIAHTTGLLVGLIWLPPVIQN